MNAGKLNRKITIQRPVPHGSFTGAGRESWIPVATVWAEVQDRLPSRGEDMANGFNVASRPARVRMRYRSDITSDMRIVLGNRIMQIVSAPAELGRREGLELVVEDYSTAGGES